MGKDKYYELFEAESEKERARQGYLAAALFLQCATREIIRAVLRLFACGVGWLAGMRDWRITLRGGAYDNSRSGF